MILSRVIACGLLAAFCAVGAVAAPVVTALELRSDVAVDRPQDLLRWIALEVGKPLTAGGVATSLRNLHASGIASHWAAYQVDHAGGAKVVFVLRGKTLVERVEWAGVVGLKNRRVAQALAIAEGDALLADRVFRSVYRLQDLYAAEGYLQASIRVKVDSDDARRRAVVRFQIDSGEPSTIAGVEFEGDTAPLTDEALRDVLRSKTGGRYFAKKARDDRERLETWLLTQGYRQAEVDGPVVNVADGRLVDLRYAVNLGPRFTVEVAEGVELPRRWRPLLPLAGDERYDETTLERTRARLESEYQQRGFYAADVTVDETVEEDGRKISVDVTPGERRVLRSVSWVGNETLADERLQSVMKTSARSALATGSGRLVDAWLLQDVAALEALYALEGFPAAVVGPVRITEVGKDGLALEIPVAEGRRQRVRELTFSGIQQLDVESLRTALPLRAGGPYHRRRDEEALALIRSRYEGAGFNLAQVTSRLEWSPDADEVDVRIEVLEGPQSLVERVIVRGQRRTQLELIRRVLDLEPGQPLSQNRLRSLQRRLYGLGIFSQVDVGLVPGTPYSGGRDVMVEVREGQRKRLGYGLGYDSEDGVRGLIGYSHANLWGRAVSGRIDLRLSQRDRQLRALLRQPLVSRWRLPVTYSLFSTDELQESFRSLREGFQVEVQRPRGRALWGLLYTYKTIEIDEPDPGLEPILIDREFREVSITSLTPSLFVDHRDDPVDPRRGWSSTVLTELAFPSLDAEEEFTRVFAQHARYLPLGRAVLAGSLRAGAIAPRAGAGGLDPVCVDLGLALANCDVKISERFFAGGRTTHRAYRRDELGIVGETLLEVGDEGAPVPFGGNGLLLANVDYRFPLAGGLGGTLFVDGGNVWADWRDVAVSELKWGAGVGVRYASPVGPIRLEIGWKLDKLPGEDPYVVLFSIGNAF
jgi:outer membrane protein assembly complex protein YaeT